MKDEEMVVKNIDFAQLHPGMDEENNDSTTAITTSRSTMANDNSLARRRAPQGGKLDKTTLVLAKVCATLVELRHAVESKCKVLVHINVPGAMNAAEWNSLSGSIAGLTRSLIRHLHDSDINREVLDPLLLDLEFFVTRVSDMERIREHMSDSKQVLPPFVLVEEDFKLLQRVEMFLLTLLNSLRRVVQQSEDEPSMLSAAPNAMEATTTCYYILLLGFLFGALSLALSVYITVSGGGIGNGFTAGAWVLTVGGLALGPWAAAHSSHCTCWRRLKKSKTK